MRKIKFYIFFVGIVLCISILGILIGVGFAKIQENHPEYLSIGLIRGIIVFGFAQLLSMYLHEMVHAIVFILQGIDIRIMYLFPICVVNEDGQYKISVAFNLQVGFGGIVIPKLSSICNEKEYNALRKKISLSVICAPLLSALLGIVSLILACCTTEYIKEDIRSYYFVFFVAMIFWSIYINGMSLLSFGNIVGDYFGAIKMKTDEVYSLLQIYNYFLLQDNKQKESTRTTQRFLIDRMRQNVEALPLDKNAGTMKFLLADAFLYEMIMNPKCHTSVLSEPEKLNDIICSIQEKIQFESYSCFLCHAIIYLNLCGNAKEALNLWENYSEKIAKSKSGIYRYKQAKLSFYESDLNAYELNENIEISSMDSLLSKLLNYYDDEKYINNYLVGKCS